MSQLTSSRLNQIGAFKTVAEMVDWYNKKDPDGVYCVKQTVEGEIPSTDTTIPDVFLFAVSLRILVIAPRVLQF